jgi:tetratricopeptide (TPR) repeat protein
VPLAIVCIIHGDYQRAVVLADEARRAAESHEDVHNLAFAHYALTSAKLALGLYAEARAHGEEACRLTRTLGTRWFLAYPLNESGKVARAMGNLAAAQSFFEDSYAIKREFEDPEGMAVALNHLAEIAYLQADYATAQRLYEEALNLYADINDLGGRATSAKGLGQVACAQRVYEQAQGWFMQAFDIALEIHFWQLVFALMLDIGRLFMATGRTAFAVEILGFVQQQPATDFTTKEQARQQLAQWQNDLPAGHFVAALGRGAACDVTRMVAQLRLTFATPAHTAHPARPEAGITTP